MEKRINILAGTLEQMHANAEDNGRDGIQPMLTLDDVLLIIKALTTYEDLVAAKTCATEDRKNASLFADTVEGMLSYDYKERFKAEYIQTKIRYERLKAFNNRIEAARRTSNRGVLGVEIPPYECPDDLLREQQSAMGQYLHVLEVRAVIEGVDLKESKI